jgi:hypothetical protein
MKEAKRGDEQYGCLSCPEGTFPEHGVSLVTLRRSARGQYGPQYLLRKPHFRPQ